MGNCSSAPRLKVNLRAFIAANPPTDGYGDEWYFDTMNVLLDRWAYSHVQFLRRKFLEATGDKGEKELDKKGFFKLFGELQDMPKAVADSSFRMFDTDNSGKLNFREFCCALALCCLLMSSDDEKISFVFDMFDTNDDGLLSGSDLQLLLEYALPKEDAKGDSRGDDKDSKRQQHIADIKQELLASSQHLTFERFYEWAARNLESLNNLLHTFQIVPSPERERALCEEILARNQSLIEGSTWYCISHKWLQIWKAHTGWMGPSPGRRVLQGLLAIAPNSGPRERGISGDSVAVHAEDDTWSEDQVGWISEQGFASSHHVSARPPEIDNSDLEGEHKGELKMNLVEHLDYELIPEEMWLKLVEWYGGGPAIMRKVICMGQDNQPQVELYPPLVLVVVAGESGQPLPQFSRRFFISRQSSLDEVLQMLAEKLKKPADKSRLWHRAKGEQWRLVRHMDATLEEFLEGKVWDAGAFLLETQAAAGNWPREEAAPLPGDAQSYQVGDAVEVRDSDADPWYAGTVTSLDPLKVTRTGWDKAYNWQFVRPGGSAQAGSASAADQELQHHFEVGDRVEAQSGVTNQWMQGTIVDVIQGDSSSAPSQVKIHYDSTVYKNDEWISTDADRLAPLDTHTNGANVAKASGSAGGTESPPAVKGATGLQNLGNTCFMNATVQCIANTPLLREYFLSSQHLRDLSERGSSARGRLAEEFGNVMTDLWSGKSASLTPRNLKRTIDQIAPQFAGYEQHDAQELLAFFLDGLHEDLNRNALSSNPSGKGITGSRRESGTPKLFKTMAARGGAPSSSAPSSPKRARQRPPDGAERSAERGGSVPTAPSSSTVSVASGSAAAGPTVPTSQPVPAAPASAAEAPAHALDGSDQPGGGKQGSAPNRSGTSLTEWLAPIGERRQPPVSAASAPSSSGPGPRRVPEAEQPTMRSIEATAAEGAYIDDEEHGGEAGCPAGAGTPDDATLPWEAPLPPPTPPKPPLLNRGHGEPLERQPQQQQQQQQQPPRRLSEVSAGSKVHPAAGAINGRARAEEDKRLASKDRSRAEEEEPEGGSDSLRSSSAPATGKAKAANRGRATSEAHPSAPTDRRNPPPTASRGEPDKRTGASRWWSFAWGRERGALDLPAEHIGPLDLPRESSDALSDTPKDALAEPSRGQTREAAAAGNMLGGNPATGGHLDIGSPPAISTASAATSSTEVEAGLGAASAHSSTSEEPRLKLPAGAGGVAAAAARAREGAEVSDDSIGNTYNESDDFVPELLTPQRVSYRRSLSLFSLGWRRRRPDDDSTPVSPKRRSYTTVPPTMVTLQEEKHEGGSDRPLDSEKGLPAEGENSGSTLGGNLPEVFGTGPSAASGTPAAAAPSRSFLPRKEQSASSRDPRAGRTKEKESSWSSFLRRSKSRDGSTQRRMQPAISRPPPAPHQGDVPLVDGAAPATESTEETPPNATEARSSAATPSTTAVSEQRATERAAGLGRWNLWKKDSVAARGVSPVVAVSVPGRLPGADDAQAAKEAAGDVNESEEEVAAVEEKENESVPSEEVAAKEGTDEVDEDNLPDDDKAALQWERHRSQNRSPIVDVFEGQLRSQLTCRRCGAQSSTFETFRYLSVPIPSDHVDRATLRVVFFPLPFSRSLDDERQQLMRYSVTVPKSSTASRVERALTSKLPVPMSSVLLAEVYRSRIHRYLDRDLPLSDIRAEDQLFAFEVLQSPQELIQYQEKYAPSRPMSSARSSRRPSTADEESKKKHMAPRVLLIQAMHRRVVDVCRSDGRTWAQRREVFGLPFVMSAASSWTYATLHDMLMLHAHRFLRPTRRDQRGRDQAAGHMLPEERQVPFVARIVNASGTACGACDRRNCTGCLLPKGSAKLRLRAALLAGAASTAKIYLALDWVDSAVYDKEYVDSVVDAPQEGDDVAASPRPDSAGDTSARESSDRANAPKVPVAACIDAFAQPEELKVEFGNGVHCEKCGKVVDAVKTLQVWREPDVLILHIKRFHFSGVHFEKLNTPIDLPFRELSLRPWIVGPSASTAAPYELYGIACHWGGMSGGHYASFCMNSEGKEPTWLKFNDETVTNVSISHEKGEIAQQCYVLFYRKRAFSSSNLINYAGVM